MDPTLAELLNSLISDALKIVGPAVIAALATYKATKIQYELKLQEIESSHRFKAREALVEHYKLTSQRFNEAYISLSNTLAQFLGFSASAVENKREENELSNSISGIVDMYVALAPFDVKVAIRDLKSENLVNTEEFTRLQEYLLKASNLKATRIPEELHENIYSLLEIYSFLSRCNSLMLEEKVNSIFSKFVEKV